MPELGPFNHLASPNASYEGAKSVFSSVKQKLDDADAARPSLSDAASNFGPFGYFYVPYNYKPEPPRSVPTSFPLSFEEAREYDPYYLSKDAPSFSRYYRDSIAHKRYDDMTNAYSTIHKSFDSMDGVYGNGFGFNSYAHGSGIDHPLNPINRFKFIGKSVLDHYKHALSSPVDFLYSLTPSGTLELLSKPVEFSGEYDRSAFGVIPSPVIKNTPELEDSFGFDHTSSPVKLSDSRAGTLDASTSTGFLSSLYDASRGKNQGTSLGSYIWDTIPDVVTDGLQSIPRSAVRAVKPHPLKPEKFASLWYNSDPSSISSLTGYLPSRLFPLERYKLYGANKSGDYPLHSLDYEQTLGISEVPGLLRAPVSLAAWSYFNPTDALLFNLAFTPVSNYIKNAPVRRYNETLSRLKDSAKFDYGVGQARSDFVDVATRRLGDKNASQALLKYLVTGDDSAIAPYYRLFSSGEPVHDVLYDFSKHVRSLKNGFVFPPVRPLPAPFVQRSSEIAGNHLFAPEFPLSKHIASSLSDFSPYLRMISLGGDGYRYYHQFAPSVVRSSYPLSFPLVDDLWRSYLHYGYIADDLDALSSSINSTDKDIHDSPAF